MNFIKILFSAFLIVISISFGDQQRHKLYFRGIQCNMSAKYVYKNFSCFAKSYSRTFSGANIYAISKQPFSVIYVSNPLFRWEYLIAFVLQLQFFLQYKYGTIYRNVIVTPRFELCATIETSSNNRFISQAFKIINDTVPNLVHKCPYCVGYSNNRFLFWFQLSFLGAYRQKPQCRVVILGLCFSIWRLQMDNLCNR